MRTLTVFLFLSILPAVSFAEAQPLDFSNWKQQKIRAAYQRYVKSLRDYKYMNPAKKAEKKKKAQIANINYHVLNYSRQMTIKDYLDLYIAEKYPNNIKALNKAVASLSKPQIAQLLAEYQRQNRKAEQMKQ